MLLKSLWKSCLVLGLVSLAITTPLFAQEPIQRVTRLPAFGSSVTTTEDTRAIVSNPANLAFMPGAELRYQGVFLDEAVEVPWQGHSIGFGFPIPWVSLATGLRVDLIDPPEAASTSMFGGDSSYQFLTWALALRTSQTSAMGFSLQRTYSDHPLAHALSSWSFGVSTRPFNGFGLSFVAHDINRPENGAGATIGTSYDIGISVRPLGTRAIDIGLEAKHVRELGGYWVPRATLGLDIAPIGRLKGEFSWSDPFEQALEPAWIASASLAVYLNGPGGSVELAAGSVFGDGLGSEAGDRPYVNLHTDIAFRGFREPVGIESPLHAVRIRLEDTPSTRGHVALLRHLWQLAEEEDSVRAVVLELRTAPASSLARVEELRDAVGYLRAHGKQVLCHLEDNGGASLYLCSAADRILINPAGGLRFAGLRTRYFYLADLLGKLGIRADFVRIGAHKSAPEQFTRSTATEQARKDKIDLLQQYERIFAADVAAGRRIDVDDLRERIKSGPFVAEEAKAAGLLDGFAFDDQLEEEVNKLVGAPISLLDDKRSARAPSRFGRDRRIAVVYLDGDMVDGRSSSIPFLGVNLAGSYTIADAIKQAREDPTVGAIVLRIETGGGSAMAADVIWREVQLTTQVKPVVVSMGSAAASGGYYAASAANRIFANPLSITGSIGIFYGKADIAELLQKIGVNVEVYKTAPRADAESIYRPYTEDEKRELEHKVKQFYDMFLKRVAEGRKAGGVTLSVQDVDSVGQGRVWTGAQAAERRLVDELGGLRQALSYARKLADLPDYAPIIELPVVPTTLLGKILGIEGIREPTPDLTFSTQLVALLRPLGPFLMYAPDKPLARLELWPVGP